MNFDFDPAKSVANETKHGIDFVHAQVLWTDPMLLEIGARIDREPRYIAIGRIEDKLWAAICVSRNGRVRLISVRRARQREIDLYEGQ